MPTRLGAWLYRPVRTPARAAGSAAALVLLALAGWYGLGALRFHRHKTAAQEALATYDFPEAERRLARCLTLRPDDPAALLLAAQAARRDGRLDDAQAHLDRFHEATPEGALQAALLRVQRGLVKQNMEELLDHIEVRHPASEQILEALAQGCVHVYRLDQAMFWTKQLLDRFPKNPVGRLLDAQTNETMRRRPRALAIMGELVQDHPASDKARLYLADLLFKANQHEDAARHYRELHRRRPHDLAPLLGLAAALVNLERLDEAVPLLADLEKQHGDNAAALLTCARFALRQQRTADAERLLRRALVLAPRDHEVHFELAACLGQLNRTEESHQHLEEFKKIEADMKELDRAFQAMVKDPADPTPRREAGRICLRNGQVAEGLRWLYGALEADPHHIATHQVLADFHAARGDHARAAEHRRAAESAPSPR